MAPLKRIGGRGSVALAAGLFALNVALNIPLFAPGETPYRDSIEGGYAGMARFFAEHPNPWGWNPTQYCGLPAQFTLEGSRGLGLSIVQALVTSELQGSIELHDDGGTSARVRVPVAMISVP